jgi:flagellar biosynthesis protein FliQ
MSVGEVIEIHRDLFLTGLLVALPALAVSLLVGLAVSLFQTVTSIQDQTLSYVPKIFFVGVTIVLTLGLSFELAIGFAQRMMVQAASAGPAP